MNRKIHLAPQLKKIVLVGCGGTGSYLAQGLAKLIAGYRLPVEVLLVDPDTVEEKNCARQNFSYWEIGEPKAQALAFRLNQHYGLSFAAVVAKGEEHVPAGLTKAPKKAPGCHVGRSSGYDSDYTGRSDFSRLVITCVDTVEARKHYRGCGPWLDLGNGVETGQAIYGTSCIAKAVRAEIEMWDKSPHVGALPDPYLVAGMAKLKPSKKQAASCADTPFAEQGVFANEWAAAAGLTILHQLLVKGELTTPAIYFDSGKGRMSPEYITREFLQR